MKARLVKLVKHDLSSCSNVFTPVSPISKTEMLSGKILPESGILPDTGYLGQVPPQIKPSYMVTKCIRLFLYHFQSRVTFNKQSGITTAIDANTGMKFQPCHWMFIKLMFAIQYKGTDKSRSVLSTTPFCEQNNMHAVNCMCERFCVCDSHACLSH